MNKIPKSVLVALLFVIIIAAFFRLYNITEIPPGLYPDEAMNGNNALEALSTGNWKVFYPENNGREGLFMNIQALSVLAFGNKPWALRSVSAVFGIFTVLGIFFLARLLFKNKKSSDYIALLSAFLTAASFWHINFSRIGFRAIMAPFFLVWAVYFILKSIDERNYKSTVIAGIFYGLGFYSYIAFRATPLLIAVIFLSWFFKFKELRFELVKKFAVLVMVSLIVFAPLGYYFVKNPQDFFGRTSQISVFNSPTALKDLSLNIVKTLGMFNFAGDWNWRHNYAGRPELYWPVGIMFLIGVVVGIYHLFKKETGSEEKFPLLVIFSWFVAAALPIVISNEGLPHALRAIIMIPAVFILAGFGGILIYEKLSERFAGGKKLLNAASVIILFLVLADAYVSYFVKWANNPNTQGAFAADYVEIGRLMNEVSSRINPPPVYVIVEASGTDVRGIPMPSQTVMFITDTFTPDKQKAKNVFYILPGQEDKIPPGAYTVVIK